MSEHTKLKLISDIIDGYYDCGYEADVASTILDTIFIVINFEENDD